MSLTKKIIVLALASILLSNICFFAINSPANAATTNSDVKIDLQVPLPNPSKPAESTTSLTLCSGSGNDFKCSGIADYITKAYLWLLGTMAIVTVLIIMVAGLMWMTAAGNKSRIGNAKKLIENALIGIAALFASYTILYAINPDLVSFKPLELQSVENIAPEEIAAQKAQSIADSNLINSTATAPALAVAGFKNITFKDGPKKDIEAGGVISSNLVEILKAADATGIKVIVGTLKTGHNQYSSSGYVSLHWQGKGADIVGEHAQLLKLSQFIAANYKSSIYEMFYCYADAPMIKKKEIYPNTIQTLTSWDLCSSHKDHLHFGMY